MTTENKPKLPPIEMIALQRADLIIGVINAGGEVDDATMEALNANLEAIEAKAEAYLAIMSRLEYESARDKETADAYVTVAKRKDAAYEVLRQRLAAGLRAAGLEKCKAGSRTVSVIDGKESLVIDDVNALPADCVTYDVKTVEVINKDRIRQMIADGKDIKGACITTGPATIRVTTPRKKAEKADKTEKEPAQAEAWQAAA